MTRTTWRIVAFVLGVVLTSTASALLYVSMSESARAAKELDQRLSTASESSWARSTPRSASSRRIAVGSSDS